MPLEQIQSIGYGFMYMFYKNHYLKPEAKYSQAHKLNREDAMDRIRWMKQIRDD